MCVVLVLVVVVIVDEDVNFVGWFVWEIGVLDYMGRGGMTVRVQYLRVPGVAQTKKKH